LNNHVSVLPARHFPDLVVATPRLHIRALEIADAPDAELILADRMTRRWLRLPAEDGTPDGLVWCTEVAGRQRDTGDGDHYGVLRREDGRLVGLVWTWRTDWTARTTEVSFLVAPGARGYGVAAEAVDALAIALLLEHGFQRIELRIAPGNLSARRVAEKAGFVYEGLQRNAGYVHGGRVDLEMWSLVTADLQA
jgi:[ribosomal protein S5]-alanine N-acetyltransferase